MTDESYHRDVDEGPTTVNPRSRVPTDPGPLEPDAAGALEQTPVVAGYQLLRPLGQGGMGVVWEAIELRFDRRVAIKVHRRDKSLDQNDLVSEALIAAKIDDPGIVRVLDAGSTVDGSPYYTMELVDGADLAQLVAEGPVPPRRAVAIAADIARAAAAAHDHGVIHRDLKPRNVVIDGAGRARVLDFGIALRSTDTDKYSGQLVGSPSYMSPEQVNGQPLTPRSDVFSIGVILFEMLTGERPFTGANTTAVLEAIVLKTPPAPSSKAPQVHPDLDAVVARCLEKSPADRFQSARALFETLTAIVEGRQAAPASVTVARTYTPKTSIPAPSDKPRRHQAEKHLAWSWSLSSPPAELWPHMANTDRFNKAVGLPAVAFVDEVKGEGQMQRHGQARVLGLGMKWFEYPFEWVKEREFSLFRWYRSGPLTGLWARASFAPSDEGGTDLRYEMWFSARNVIGRIGSFIELEQRFASRIDHFVRRLDQMLRTKSPMDPFESPHVPSLDQRAAVADACERLLKAGFSSELVERLAMHVLNAPDGVLGGLRPYALAAAWGTDRGETLDMLVHAAHEGLLMPSWDVICPRCMIAHQHCTSLDEVKRFGNCTACAASFERDLRDSVELVFVLHPSIRRIERLTYCAGAPALRPHVVVQQVLDPGEERSVTVDLERGTYRVAGAANRQAWEVVATPVGFQDTCEIVVSESRLDGRPDVVRAGSVTFVLRNDTSTEETLRIEVPGLRDDVVPAAAALTHPSFREMFSGELLAQGEHVQVSNLAFVFVGIADREAFFERVGDTAACAEMTRLAAIVASRARENEGTVIPSALHVQAVAFPTASHALRAAREIQKRVTTNLTTAGVAIACHAGPCIALTREGTAEFFGETLLRAQALLRDCPAGGIALSAGFASDHAVASALHEAKLHAIVQPSQAGAYAGRRVTVLMP